MNLNEQIVKTATFARLANPTTSSVYTGKQNEWYTRLVSSSKGKAGQELVEALFQSRGYIVSGRTDIGHDLVINGHTVEVKSSSWWGGDAKYKFQQLRPGHIFSKVVFLGVAPDYFDLWIADRSDLDIHVFSDPKYRQHAGADGKGDTYWVSIDTKNQPSWLKDYTQL